MSPFWNHILANQADLSMCVLKSHGMSAVCTWGLRGIFFLTFTFCALLLQCCVLLCGSHLSYVCTVQVQTLILQSFWGMTYMRTSDHLPSHHLEASDFMPPSTTPHNSIATIEFTPPCNQTPFLHLRHWIHTSAMPTKTAKKAPKVGAALENFETKIFH